MKKLYIAIPCYDGKLQSTFFISLMTFLGNPSPELDRPPHVNILYGDSHVNRARNKLAKYLLETDCTHLLFIDSDIIFKPSDITMLLERNLDIVGGLYPKKETGDSKWVLNTLEGISSPDETGLMEVKYCGTGFMLIARTVFEQMRKHFQDIEYDDDSDQGMGLMWNFFHAAVLSRRWLSEDWWFSETWRNMGGKIYVDARVQLGHTGQVNFPVASPSKIPDYSSGI